MSPDNLAEPVPVVVTDRVLVVPLVDGVIVEGLSVPIVSDGRPETVRSTGLLNPFVEVKLTVYVVDCPCATVRAPGEIDIVNPGTPGPVSAGL